MRRRCDINNLVVVGVAQLAEHWVVAPVVAGSNPVTHPIHLQKFATLGC